MRSRSGPRAENGRSRSLDDEAMERAARRLGRVIGGKYRIDKGLGVGHRTPSMGIRRPDAIGAEKRAFRTSLWDSGYWVK
jgi:hypothetical protein